MVHVHETGQHLRIWMTCSSDFCEMTVPRMILSNDPEDRPVARNSLGCDVPLATHAHDAEHVDQRQASQDARQAIGRKIGDQRYPLLHSNSLVHGDEAGRQESRLLCFKKRRSTREREDERDGATANVKGAGCSRETSISAKDVEGNSGGG